MSVVVGAILVDRQKLLLGRRSKHKSYAGCWDIIGGHVETGETIWSALQRELLEEIGVDAISGEYIIALPLGTPSKAVTLHIYRLSSWQGEPVLKNDEHSELRWFDIHAASRLPDLATPLYRTTFSSLRG